MMDCNIAGLGFTQGAPSSTPAGAPAGSSEELAALFAGILAGLEEAGAPDDRAALGSASPGEPEEETAAEETPKERDAEFALCVAPAWSLPLPQPAATAAAGSTPTSESNGTSPQAIRPAAAGAAAAAPNGVTTVHSPDAVPAPPVSDAPAAGDLPDEVQAAEATAPPPAVDDPARASRDKAARALARALADVGLSRQVQEGEAAQVRDPGQAEANAVQPAAPGSVVKDPAPAAAVGAGHVRASSRPENQHDTAAATSAAVQIAVARGSGAASADTAAEHDGSDDHSRPSSGEAAPALPRADRIGPDSARAPAFAVDHPTRLDRTEPRVPGSAHVAADRLTDAESSGVAQQLVQSIRVQAREGINEAHVRLRPEHLGEVRISIKAEGDRIAAILHIERADVRHAVESQGQDLRTQLASHGLHLDELTVRDDGEPRHGRQAPPDQDAPNRRHRRSAPDREFELESES